MKKTKLHFILGNGIYPDKVGGMEIFNYYFIDSIKDRFDISYQATNKLGFEGAKWVKTYNIKPEKLFAPLQVIFYLLFHPSIKKVLISFSEAHWLIWYLYTLINTLLGREYYVVIHFGKSVPEEKPQIYKKFFHKAKNVIAVSHDIKKNYDSKYGINCEVIYPLVPFYECETSKEELRKEYGIPADANVICMVGSIKDMKHPETILDAVSQFSKEEMQQYKPHIVYAGSGNMLQPMKEKAGSLGIADNVHFLGFVPKEQVNKVFKMSDMYIIASDFEGTSVSLLEAMFNKLPIIASDAPGINDMVKDNVSALLFKTKCAVEVKEHIKTIIDTPELAQNISDGAYREFEAKYSYKNVIDRYTEIFKNNI